MDFADPGELRRQAQKCDQEADRLKQIIDSLNSGSRSSFAAWTGIAANSLDDAIRDQAKYVSDAEKSLRSAAQALRTGAAEVEEAIERERREREKAEELRKERSRWGVR